MWFRAVFPALAGAILLAPCLQAEPAQASESLTGNSGPAGALHGPVLPNHCTGRPEHSVDPAWARDRLNGTSAGAPWYAADPAWAADGKGAPPEPGPIRRRAGSPSWPDDFELGLQAARAYAYYFGLVEEDSLLDRVNRLGYKVASQVGRDDILFTFHVIDIPDPNAFALPGGFIFITRGMMDMHLPDHALANLLGHEIGHVAENHFSRNSRLSGFLSLLQTAALVAAIIAVPSSPGGGWDVDQDTGAVRTSLVGKDAAIQGTSLFGGVLRELLLRGYSRNLEFEADDRGRRYAARAGYPVQGSVVLLEELHRRVYEDQEYGYWHTHPYFQDRVARAEAARDAGGSPPSQEEVNRYRADVQRRLSALAESILDEPTSLFLFRAALRAGPGGASAFDVEHRLLIMRTERLRQIKTILRSYGPLIADYDTLLARMDRAGEAGGLREEIAHERRVLDVERDDLRPQLLEVLKGPNPRTLFLELFLDNFPEDPEAPAVRTRLAEQYRLSDRPDEAALVLDEMIKRSQQQMPPAEEGSPSPHEDSPGRLEWSLGQMRRVIEYVRSPLTSQQILMETPSDSVRLWAEARLRTQAAELDSLELASRFIEEYPDSPVASTVIERLEDLSMARYREARLNESLGDYQTALNLYNELILLAPESQGADLSRQGVTRIQSLAGR